MRNKILAVLLCMALCLLGTAALADGDFQFAANRYQVFEGQTLQLELLRQGDAASAADLTFTSSNQKLATVDENGLVTARSKGTVTITAAVTVGSRKVTARTTVNVQRPVTELQFNEEKLGLLAPDDPALAGLLTLESELPVLVLPVGRTTSLPLTVVPRDADNRGVTLSAEDETLFKRMTAQGYQLQPDRVGETILTVASVSNPEVALQYHVLLAQPARKVTVTLSQADVVVGRSIQATADFQPEDTTLRKVTWTTSTPKILSVDENGVVTGLTMGTGRVRATAADGSAVYGEATIRVAQQPTGVVIKSGGRELATGSVLVGGSVTLQGSVLPQNANVKTVTWSSSDDAVATVNANGTVKGVKAGVCVITCASTVDEAIFASIPMVVEQRVTGITPAQKSLTLNVNETAAIRWETAPYDATNPAVTLTSSNKKVATVDEAGTVQALSRGTTQITIKAADGSNKSATVSVTVNQPPTGVTIKGGDSVLVGHSMTLQGVVEPSNANVKTVTWTSSDPRVATVSTGGRVTGVKAGICVITCTSTEDPAIFNSKPVTVIQRVTKIEYTVPAMTLNVGETGLLSWTVAPEDATDKTVTLSTANKNVATVDQDGTVHAVKRGETYITVKANDGSNRSAKIKVTVLQPVYGVHMRNDTITVGVGETVTARAELEPSDASNRNMTWSIADTSLATVKGTNNLPRVFGIAWGTTTLTGFTEDGGYMAQCTVKVGRNEQALKILKVAVENNRIRLLVHNESNMNITRFYFRVECFNNNDDHMVVAYGGADSFTGYYMDTLYEGENTVHGRFHFDDYLQPDEEIGRVVFTITGYRCDDGFSFSYRPEQMPKVEYKGPNWTEPQQPSEDDPIVETENP